MGHQMGHAAFSSIRFTQFRVYMMLPEHAVHIIPSAPTISLKCWVYLVGTLVLIIVRKSTVKRQNYGFRP